MSGGSERFADADVCIHGPSPHCFSRGTRNGVRKLVLSPNGKILASGGMDSTIKLWNASTGELLHILPVPEQTVKSLAFSPDGSMLASGSSTHEEGRITSSHALLWDTATGTRRWNLGSGTGNDDPGPNVDEVAFYARWVSRGRQHGASKFRKRRRGSLGCPYGRAATSNHGPTGVYSGIDFFSEWRCARGLLFEF